MPSTRARRPRRERGSITPFVVLAVPTLVVLVGLVTDGGGQIQGSTHAQHVASSAARYATGEISGEAISGGSLTINPVAAEQSAREFVAASGLEGTAHVNGDTVTVTVTGKYQTKFLSIIGINELNYSASASAKLINSPED